MTIVMDSESFTTEKSACTEVIGWMGSRLKINKFQLPRQPGPLLAYKWAERVGPNSIAISMKQ